MALDRNCYRAADEDAQVALGQRLVAACEGKTLIFLHGDLGAGKTTLTRGLLRGLGHTGAAKSPTYTLIEPYALPAGRLFHLDLYRVGDPGELEYLGLRELLDEPAVIVIEWPERGAGWLPSPDLDVRIDYAPVGRKLCMEAVTAHGAAILERLRRNLQ